MIRVFSIRNGPAGTRQTLEEMAPLAREGAQLPYVKIIGEQYNPAEYDALMRSYWRYAEEYDETLTPVDFQIRTVMTAGYMMGDCDDAAIVIGAVALASGFHARFVATRRGPDAQFTHVFAEVSIPLQSPFAPEAWLRVDPTAPLDANYQGWERMVQDV